MPEKAKPIKRSAQLTPLSRDHHEGLLFCWKIRQGLKNGTSEAVLKDFAVWNWQHHLQPHFEQEEKFLLPHIMGHPYAAQLQKEHDEIRDLIRSVENNPEPSLFSTLATTLDNHIRFEERQLFGYIESILSQDQLDIISGQLSHHAACDQDWKNSFWEKNK